jgi:hypothetical protein
MSATIENCRAFTPETLAAEWGEPWTAAMIRERCRLGALPAKKCGAKKWVIPVAALAAWMADGLGQVPPRQPERGPTLPPYRVKCVGPKTNRMLDVKHINR